MRFASGIGVRWSQRLRAGPAREVPGRPTRVVAPRTTRTGPRTVRPVPLTALPAETTHRIIVGSEGAYELDGRVMSLQEIRQHIRARDAQYLQTPFEILADRRASVQAVISLLEMLRDQGAARVTMGTVRGPVKNQLDTGR